jgi:fatty acid desaturase
MNPALPTTLAQMKAKVIWRDLTGLSRIEGLIECLHPLPWLGTSWMLAASGYWPLALPFSFMFFLTALRLNHEAIHHNLGFTARGHRVVLHALSALMSGSNNAVAANHLHHHRHVMTEDDLEGKCGKLRWYQVLAYGPRFPVEMHINAWTNGGPAVRQRMAVDAMLNGAMLLLFALTGWFWLGYHLLIVMIAQCLTAFFAVWITHRGCADDMLFARTQRSKLINFASYNMLFHLEHHLFPAVPVKRLPVIAARLDAAWPALPTTARHVVEWPGQTPLPKP